MPLIDKDRSAYASKGHYRGGRAAGDDVSMDEILSSIRKIIDEEPVSDRYRSGNGAAARPQRANSVEPSVSIPLPKPARKVIGRVAGSLDHDDVLAELLAPAGDSGLSQSAAVGSNVVAVETNTAAALAILAAPEVACVDVVAGRADEVAVEAETLPEASPQANVRTADDVFGELAASLAAIDAPAPVITADLQAASTPVVHSGSAAEAKPLPSPAEAAAAAVAEVAAANFGPVTKPATVESEAVAARAAVETPTEAESPLEPAAFSVEAAAPQEPVAADAAVASIATPAPAAAPIDAVVAPAEAASAPSTTTLVPVPSGSFEDTIAGMLRPLLREWLNANMPRMVEKALKEELAHALPAALPQAIATSN